MSNSRLQDAINGLYRYFERTSVNDVAQSAPDGQPQPIIQPLSVEGIIMRHISTADGCSTGAQLLKDLKASGVDVGNLIQVYVDGNTLQPSNTLRPVLGQATSGLSAMLVNSIRITPAARDIDALTLFLNVIPTLEISRCVPYLSIDVTTGRPPTSRDGRLQGMTLLRFLMGSSQVAQGTADASIALGSTGQSVSLDPLQGSFDTTTSGMELFTSPQMLVDPDPSLDAGRATPALDKFRPFMSIDKLEVELTPQVGFFAYRTADLDITLHDRSRLSEIADFIKPDLYGKTELLIEYGWSHPDTSGNNAYGTLINAMRAREKYGVVNSSFSFTRTGEVKLKLKLFTKGASDIRVVKIGDNADVRSAVRSVRDLQKRIAELRISLSQSKKSIREVRGEQELFSAAEDVQSSLVLSPEAAKELRTFVRSSGSSKSFRDLKARLIELFGKDGKHGVAKVFQSRVSREVGDRIRLLKQPDSKNTADPFLASGAFALEDKATSSDILGKKLKNHAQSNNFVSFARLMMLFVGLPLSSQDEKYADVQLIFYPFNGNAAACRRLNIGQFPIPLDAFERAMVTLIQTRRGAQVPLRDFIQFVANNFIDDMGSPAYRLTRVYRTTFDAQGRGSTTPKNPKLDETQLFDQLQSTLNGLGVPDGVFKMPQVDVIIETVPVSAADPKEPFRTNFDRTVLRLHFIDRVATAYESLGQIILASRDESLSKLGQLPQDDTNAHKSTYERIRDAAKKSGIITVEKGDPSIRAPDVVRVVGGADEIKAFCRRQMPSVTYGANNTAIKEASFATMQEPLLSTVNMLRAGDQGPLAPSGLSTGNLPLRTLPAKANLTMLGCPVVHYMQQLFIDFGTNTTVDNIYGVVRLTHELAPGRFDTRIDLTPLDAYGRYESLVDQVAGAIQKLAALDE